MSRNRDSGSGSGGLSEVGGKMGGGKCAGLDSCGLCWDCNHFLYPNLRLRERAAV